jgi:caffeoyl-CoA O-methyltransferase
MKLFKTCMVIIVMITVTPAAIAQTINNRPLDEKVQQFLNKQKNNWRDLNVPYEDGQVLHDLIVKNNYTSALEIGTSTGHSTIWLAWALSKTGGKLITLEIDEQRQQQAIENVKAAGLTDYVDFRLADAHKLVKELKGPFDFIFSDADKDWYPQYFKDLDPKLKKGGCFTAHNVANPYGGIRDFLDLVQKNQNYTTIIDRTSRSGISISYKK